MKPRASLRALLTGGQPLNAEGGAERATDAAERAGNTAQRPADATQRAASSQERESLLVVSDVHLGSDLNDLLPADAVLKRSRAIDEDLVALLHHYRGTPPRGSRWRLVVAGDFIDFIGITIVPRASTTVRTELSAEEKRHGLGNTADHARAKLDRVASRHADVFEALAHWVADGHALTLVHGNHDVEFHWDDVKEGFKSALARHARSAGRVADDDAELRFRERVEFHPWFFYVGGVAYIEHGHQYDPLCSTEHVMAPVSPLDPRRIARGFSDVLVRWVVRPTRGLTEYGHEKLGLLDYVAFAARLGTRGLFALAGRFGSAVVEMVRLHKASISENARTLQEEHERRIALLAEASRVGKERLLALLALQSPPVTRSLRGVLASVLLDRLALALFASLILFVLALVGARSGHGWAAAACVVAGWHVANRYLEKQRRLDFGDDMQDRAATLARLFPAAFVIMGHTHMPQRTELNDGQATYINVGSWAEDDTSGMDVPTPAPRAPRTHLVIHVEEAGPRAEFLTWQPQAGPRPWT